MDQGVGYPDRQSVVYCRITVEQRLLAIWLINDGQGEPT